MENELLKIFDQDRNQIGVATREEVHRKGYWHEVFHCWFISHENDKDYIILQLRSGMKKEHPNLLDITAAGHLLANETVKDGVREVKEELGVDVPLEELRSLGDMDYCSIQGNYIDNEIANVFLYKCDQIIEDFKLQEEEVAGIVKAEFTDFLELWLRKKDAITITGFKLNTDGNKIFIDKEVGRDQFVPHPGTYYETILKKIKEQIRSKY